MPHDEEAEMSGVMQRLARVEADLWAAQARIVILEQRSQRQTKRAAVSRRVADGLAVALLAVALGITRAPRGEAQAKPANKAASKAGSARGHVVRAPFSVVDAQGQTILRVQDRDSAAGRGIFVFNSQGKLAVNASADEKGHGTLIARNGGGERVTGPGAGIRFDSQGNAVLGMKGADDKLFLTVDNKGLQLLKQDAVIVNLGLGNQGGLMNLCDYGGNTMIEAGILANNRGVVRVFPMGGPVGLTIPNYIMGAKPK